MEKAALPVPATAAERWASCRQLMKQSKMPYSMVAMMSPAITPGQHSGGQASAYMGQAEDGQTGQQKQREVTREKSIHKMISRSSTVREPTLPCNQSSSTEPASQ